MLKIRVQRNGVATEQENQSVVYDLTSEQQQENCKEEKQMSRWRSQQTSSQARKEKNNWYQVIPLLQKLVTTELPMQRSAINPPCLPLEASICEMPPLVHFWTGC